MGELSQESENRGFLGCLLAETAGSFSELRKA